MPTKVISLTVSNVKGIKLASIDNLDKRAVTIIGGKNGQGKSSLIDSSTMALCGARAFPDEPLKKGEEHGSIDLVLDPGESDLLPERCRVRRDFHRKIEKPDDVSTELNIVTTADGIESPSPQKILDKIVGEGFGFDPLKFVKAKPAVQADMLRSLVGLDFTKLDERRQTIYDHRTAVGRQRDQMAAVSKQDPDLASLPQERVDVSEVTEAMERAAGHNAAINTKRQVVLGLEATAVRLGDQIEATRQKLADMEIELQRVADDNRQIMGELENMAEIDTAEIQGQLQAADAKNRLFDLRDGVIENINKKQKFTQQYKDLTAKITKIAREKKEMTAKAKWPIQGLGFNDNGVTLNDIPFGDLSSSEQLRCAVAIAIRKNPEFPFVIIPDGSLLDFDAMVDLTQITADLGGQVLIERVGEDECHIVLKDGEGTEVPDTPDEYAQFITQLNKENLTDAD